MRGAFGAAAVCLWLLAPTAVAGDDAAEAYRQARAILDEGNLLQGVSALQRVAKRYPQYATVFKDLGIIFAEYGMGRQESAAYLKRYLELTPDTPPNDVTRTTLARFETTMAALSEGAVTVAAPSLDLSHGPAPPEELSILERLGRWWRGVRERFRPRTPLEQMLSDGRRAAERIRRVSDVLGRLKTGIHVADEEYAALVPLVTGPTQDLLQARLGRGADAAMDATGSSQLLGRLKQELIQAAHEASLAYQAAIEIDALSAEAYAGLGLSLQHLAREEEALQAFRNAIAINADDPESHKALASYWLARLRYIEAIPHLEHVVRLRPKDLDSRYWLITAYGSAQQKERARAAIREYLAIAPASPQAETLSRMLKNL